MKVGVPREVKNHEYRVAITPAGVHELVRARARGAASRRAPGSAPRSPTTSSSPPARRSSPTADDVWADADLVLKVKEPVAEEYHRMREGADAVHLPAPGRVQGVHRRAGRLAASTAIAYETVQTADGALPLLAPMSEVAGRMAPQVGAHTPGARAAAAAACCMGGVSGVYAAKVVVHRRRRVRA